MRERDGGQVEHKENSHVTGFDEIKKNSLFLEKIKMNLWLVQIFKR